MKDYAIAILICILLSIVTEPMVEGLNVMREKIILGTALTNSCRASKDRSLVYEAQRDLDAKIDQDRFRDYFAVVFSDAMDASCTDRTSNTLTFAPNNDNFNDIIITLEFNESYDGTTTEVNVKAETKYKFKTKYLKLAEEYDGPGTEYKLISERKYILSIRN